MKCFRRCLSVSLCLVLLLVGFSTTANAEKVDLTGYHVSVSTQINNKGFGSAAILYPFDNTIQKYGGTYDISSGADINSYHIMTFAMDDGSAFIDKGNTSTIKIENITWAVQLGSSTNLDNNGIDNVYVYCYTTSGQRIVNYLTKDGYKITYKSNFMKDFEVNLPSYDEDIKKIEVYLQILDTAKTSGTVMLLCGENEEFPDYTYYKLTISQPGEEEKLLGGILGKLQELWNTTKDGFTNLVNGITELPQKIWTFIENGLKSLFVPDEEYLTTYKDKWDTLLENKFGAVYQVVNVTLDSWDKIKETDEKNTIELPRVSIPLPDGQQFTFGGNQVKIVPTGFEWIIDVIKGLLAGLCTILFINGLRKRYDEVMGVEQ